MGDRKGHWWRRANEIVTHHLTRRTETRYRSGYKAQASVPERWAALPSSKLLMTKSSIDKNPLLEPWTGPFEAPPFERIEPGHFRLAFDAALKELRTDIDAVAANPDPPTFANTIEVLERSGRSLDRVSGVFSNLARAATNDELQAIEREMAPILSRHRSETYLNDARRSAEPN